MLVRTTYRTPPLQSSQHFQILHVLLQIFPFRRFQHLRNFPQVRILHDEAERGHTDLAFANMFVPIDSRTTSGFRIVEMDRRKTLQANDPIEFTKHFPNSGFGPDIISGGEYMRRVEANTETLRFPRIGDYVFDLLES